MELKWMTAKLICRQCQFNKNAPVKRLNIFAQWPAVVPWQVIRAARNRPRNLHANFAEFILLAAGVAGVRARRVSARQKTAGVGN
jgi:hypothetical protein